MLQILSQIKKTFPVFEMELVERLIMRRLQMHTLYVLSDTALVLVTNLN